MNIDQNLGLRMNSATQDTGRSTKIAAPNRRVELHAIGGLRVRAGGADITEQMGPRHRALLAYLVHESRPMYPAELCTVLGRGREEDAELAGLRRAIAWLSQNVPYLKIEVSRDSVALVSRVWWDVRELDEALDRRDVKAVSRLYGGDFLEGFSCGSGPFDEWASEQRRELREYWEGAIRGRALEQENVGDWEVSADWWRILAERNPLVGDLTARTMRAYGKARQRGEAARVFEAYLERTAAAEIDPERGVEAVARELSIPRPSRTVEDASANRPASRASGPVGASRSGGSGGGRGVVQPRRRPREAGPATASVSFGPPTSRSSTRPGSADFDEDAEERVTVLGHGPRLLRPMDGSTLFTDSLFIHWSRTLWARLTTPRAIRAYRDTIDDIVELSILIARTLAEWSVVVARVSWETSRRVATAVSGRIRRVRTRTGRRVVRARSRVRRVNRGINRGVGRVGDGIGRGVARVGGGIERGVAQVGGGIERASEVTARGVEGAAAMGGQAGRGLGEGLRRLGRAALFALAAVPDRALVLLARSSARVRSLWPKAARASSAGRGKASSRPRPAIAPQIAHAVPRFVRAVPGWTIRRRRELVGATAAIVLILGLPVADELLSRGPAGSSPPVTSEEGSLTRMSVPQAAGTQESSAESVAPRLKLPDLSLPQLSFPTITLPKPDIQTPPLPNIASVVPQLVRTPMERLDRLISGLLLESGDRVIIADLTDGGSGGGPALGHLAALMLEAALSDSRHFSVVPRERVLVSAATGRSDLSLRGSEALARAPDLRAAALITGRLDEAEEGALSSLKLAVIDVASGVEAHRLELKIHDGDWIAAVAEASRRLHPRLGEVDDAEGGRRPSVALSSSLPALGAYARARAHLFAGRYRSAAAVAGEAIRHDPDFAAGHQLAARAHALGGQRSAARRALDAAYRHRDRLGPRESLRVVADRQAFAGRYTDAIIAYEYLFQRYRDDVVALKSLSLLQRRIRARGRGTGHLEVAYSIEPIDWPSLDQVARYLAYTGPLPRVRVTRGATKAAASVAE